MSGLIKHHNTKMISQKSLLKADFPKQTRLSYSSFGFKCKTLAILYEKLRKYFHYKCQNGGSFQMTWQLAFCLQSHWLTSTTLIKDRFLAWALVQVLHFMHVHTWQVSYQPSYLGAQTMASRYTNALQQSPLPRKHIRNTSNQNNLTTLGKKKKKKPLAFPNYLTALPSPKRLI